MLVGATLPNTGSVGFVSTEVTADELLPPAPLLLPNEPNTFCVVLLVNVPNCETFVVVELLVEELTVDKLLLAGELMEEPNIGVADAFDELPKDPKIFVEAGVVVVVDDVDKHVVVFDAEVVIAVDVEVTLENNVLLFVDTAELLPKLKPPKVGVACELVACGIDVAGELKLNIGFTDAVEVDDVTVVAVFVLPIVVLVELMFVVDVPKPKPMFLVVTAVTVLAGVGALKAKLSRDFFSSTVTIGLTSILFPNEKPPVVEVLVLDPKLNVGAATPVGLSLLIVVLVFVEGKENLTLGVLTAIVLEDIAVVGVDVKVAVVEVDVVVNGLEPKVKPVEIGRVTVVSFVFAPSLETASILKPV